MEQENEYCTEELVKKSNDYILWLTKEISSCHSYIRYVSKKLEDLSGKKAVFDFCVKYGDHFSPQTCRDIECKYHFPKGSIKAKFYENLAKKIEAKEGTN